jgi:Fic family protein
MFVEVRESGSSKKYYLVHSYRDLSGKVQKIRRYLGSNLKSDELEKLKQRAAQIILEQIAQLNTQFFDFSLSEKEINALNAYDQKINVDHFQKNGNLQKKEWDKFATDFVYNTNAIEGSKVLQKDVQAIIDKKPSKKMPLDSEEIETKGVARAIDYVKNTKDELSLKLIKKLHWFCFRGSKDFAGKFRTVEVIIRNAKGEIIHQGTPYKNMGSTLRNYINWYAENKNKFQPLLLAAIMHNEFEKIHPFQDGNGRVGRLILNYVLIKNYHPPINILLEDRQEYYKTLFEYSNYHNIRPTMKFLQNQYKKTLKRVATN